MSLHDIAEAIAAQMTEIDPTVTPSFAVGADFGANKLTVEHAEPRIIYVPQSETIVGADSRGGDPRALFIRKINVAAHLWGADVPAVELMLNTLVQAMQLLMHGSYALLGGQWATAADVVTDWGVLFTLNMQWQVPITRVPDTYAVTATMPITPEIVITS